MQITPADDWGALSFDVERARAETPGTFNVVHLNSAGASLMPRPVIDVMVRHLEVEAEMGAYEAAEHHHQAIGLLRISMHYYNTVEELARFCSVLESLAAGRSLHAVSSVPAAM